MVSLVLWMGLGCASREAPPAVAPGSPVVVSTREILPGETLGASNVQVTMVSLEPPSDSTFTTVEELTGRAVWERLLPGEPIRSERLLTERTDDVPTTPVVILRGDGDGASGGTEGAERASTGAALPFSPLLVPRGMRATTLSVAPWSSTFVRAGGYVDLYATREQDGVLTTTREARQLQVLATEGAEVTVAYLPGSHGSLDLQATWTAAVLQPVDVTMLELHGPPVRSATLRPGAGTVWVARSDLYPGLALGPDDFMEASLLEGHEADPTLQQPQDVVGKVLGERVLAGEPLRKERVSRGEAFPEARLPRGFAGISVPGTLVQTSERQAQGWVTLEGQERLLLDSVVVVHRGDEHSLVAVPDGAAEGLVHALQAPELTVVFR